MRALIQKHGGEFANINVLTACLGFVEKGYVIEFFEDVELSAVHIDDEAIVVGGISAVATALKRRGWAFPDLVSMPLSLGKYARRRIWTGTLREAREAVDAGRALFVKPTPGDGKLFAGKVVASYRDLAITASLPGDYPIICAEVVNMLSEYRVFVVRGQVVGCRHYKGDFRRFPDFGVIDAAVREFDDAPSGYGIDFAVTETGDTVLVEVNEGLALGSYGLPSLPYASLIEARWDDFRNLPAGVLRGGHCGAEGLR